MSYSVILPTFREYRNLRVLLPKLILFFKKRGNHYEVVVVDDNSRDGTAEYAASLAKDGVRLVERVKERGLASAIRHGTKVAKYNTIVRMDSDLSHSVTDLGRLIREYEQRGPKAVIIGSRFMKGSRYTGKPWLHRLASLAGRNITRVLLGLPVADLSNNFRVFSRSLWQKILPDLRLDGNIMLVQELVLLKKNGATIVELPTKYRERRIGKSHLRILPEAYRFFTALPTLFGNAYGH